MKNIFVILLFCISQIALGQFQSRPISEFIDYDSDEEILIDVRTPQEFGEGHINGAINIDWFSDDFNKQVAVMDKEKTIYVYCKKGGRSLKSQAKLKELGFLRVINLEGGYDVWHHAKN